MLLDYEKKKKKKEQNVNFHGVEESEDNHSRTSLEHMLPNILRNRKIKNIEK